jgi:hypothetical protein
MTSQARDPEQVPITDSIDTILVLVEGKEDNTRRPRRQKPLPPPVAPTDDNTSPSVDRKDESKS